MSPARAAAFEILLRVQREDAFASELLHSRRFAHLSPADHGFLTELVMGVLRWRSGLDAAIAAVSSQPIEKLDAEVLNALRLGAYQLGWLERVPARAAIHESVELVKKARKRSASGFANAVLRKLVDDRGWCEPKSSGVANPSSLAQQFSHPEWLVKRWSVQLGSEQAERICEYNQRPPISAIRLRDPAAEQELSDAGIQLAPGALLSSARRVVSGNITHTEAFRAQRVVVQDEGSQLIAALLGSGSRLLDCCAAPGSKTSAFADRNPRATVIALDVHPHRARLLRRLVRCSQVQVMTADARTLPLVIDFDRVLADVPCSGTGTLARNPEIKWRLQPDDIADLHLRQFEILSAALSHLAVGGRLVYSTCSLEREENEDVVSEVLAGGSNLRVVDCAAELSMLKNSGELVWPNLESLSSGQFLRTIPGVHPCDGFFAALIERAESPTD